MPRMATEPKYFFSCDWGTTYFRMRLGDCSSGRAVGGSIGGSPGVRDIAGRIPADASTGDRAAVFARRLAHWMRCLPGAETALKAGSPAVVSGMASSSIGWQELRYARLPFPVDGSQSVCQWLQVTVDRRKHPVLLVSGVAGDTDMMRGEETQLIGLLALPGFDRLAAETIVVLPGTHSKHIHVKNGRVTGLQTYLTGELFQVLREHTVLRFTTGGETDRVDEIAFGEGVAAAQKHGALNQLFQARTRGVLNGRSGPANRMFLSGLLVGGELSELVRGRENVPILLAAGSIGRLYELAARMVGLEDRLTVAPAEHLEAAVVLGQQRLLAAHLGTMR